MNLSPNGVVVVDKPAGMTSHDVVGIARKLFKTKRVGHTGTLDPDATGVLMLCIGQGTRLAEYLSASSKHYTASVTFGIETDTLDASGAVLAERDASALTEAEVVALLPRFRGTIEQTPPMMSARHHEGKRLYELAREGVTVEREARPVQIDELELTAFASGTQPIAMLEITCSTGTYIRTLAADLGTTAGTGAIMSFLRRTWVGKNIESAFTLAESYTLDALRERAEAGTIAETLLPLPSALRGWTILRLSESQSRDVQHGRALPFADFAPDEADRLVAMPDSNALLALLNANGDLQAIAKSNVNERRLQPVKVFADPQSE